MKSLTTPRFWQSYRELPPPIKAAVRKQYHLWSANPRHPSLGVNRIQGLPDVWEGRIDVNYRFTFHYDGDTCVFRNIGPHAIIEDEP